MTNSLRPKNPQFALRINPGLRIKSSDRTGAVGIDYQKFLPGVAAIGAGGNNNIVVPVLIRGYSGVPDSPHSSPIAYGQTGNSSKSSLFCRVIIGFFRECNYFWRLQKRLVILAGYI